MAIHDFQQSRSPTETAQSRNLVSLFLLFIFLMGKEQGKKHKKRWKGRAIAFAFSLLSPCLG